MFLMRQSDDSLLTATGGPQEIVAAEGNAEGQSAGGVTYRRSLCKLLAYRPHCGRFCSILPTPHVGVFGEIQMSFRSLNRGYLRHTALAAALIMIARRKAAIAFPG